MTIFGFNTDVKYGDAVYHVQSEARRAELVLQTMVFVKGQCIGKRTTPYSPAAEESVHEMIKAQHKMVIDAINEGKLDTVVAAGDTSQGPNESSSDNTPVSSESGAEIAQVAAVTTQAANVTTSSNGSSSSATQMITIEFQITEAGQAVPGAEVVSRAGTCAEDAVVARAVSDATGTVRIDLPFNENMQRDAITVEATYGGKCVTRKFRFKGGAGQKTR